MSRNLYKKLQTSGYCDIESEKYIWVKDMEWINPKQSKKYNGCFPKNVMPIAVTASGDVWGIVGNEIFLYSHEDDEALFYADNLTNAIFRAIVEYLSDNDFISENENDENNSVYAVNYVKKCTEIFSEDFSDEQINDLNEILKNNISEFHYSNGAIYHSFISVEQASKIIKKYINYDDSTEGTEYNVQASNGMLILSECFSDEVIEQLRKHCMEGVKTYLNAGEKFSQNISENNNLQKIVYKNCTNDLYLYCLGDIFIDGSFYTGVKKKQCDEVKGHCTEYYIDESGSPVYAKHYASGNMKPPYAVSYYFVSANSIISVEYAWNKDKNEYIYSHTAENTFNSEGKLLSFIKYDKSEVMIAEYYVYINDMLAESNCMEVFSFNEKIGIIDDPFTLKGFRENPMRFSKNVYEYKDNIIISVHKINCNDEGCKQFSFDVTEKIYKSILKKKLI